MRLQTDLQERVLLSAFRLEDIVTEPMRLHFITCQIATYCNKPPSGDEHLRTWLFSITCIEI